MTKEFDSVKFLKENAILILAFAILFLGIGLVLAMPYMLTQWTIGVPFGERTGQIGDSIGGTTAPVLGVLSSFLIFLSFYVQYKFNKQQNERIEQIESREIEKDAIDTIMILSSFVSNYNYRANYENNPKETSGAQAWFLMLDELEAIVYERWDKAPALKEDYWTEMWDGAYLLKLYGLFSVALNRTTNLTKENRVRVVILLRSEALLLSKFVSRMAKIKSNNSSFQVFISDFLLLMNEIRLLDSETNAE
ncbi:MAG: hypothetical protein H6601_10335 [Flavobacteriales bacterium]|nr:hypothetical protein [Flavobacteriales bacterium]